MEKPFIYSRENRTMGGVWSLAGARLRKASRRRRQPIGGIINGDAERRVPDLGASQNRGESFRNRLREEITPHPSSIFDGHILELGLTDYEFAHQKQIEFHSKVVSGEGNEIILITEHYPVYTCGRRTKPEDRPVWTSIPIVEVERGGELTFHGPGQIVGYPILNLEKRRLSIPRYLRKLEGALACALQQVGILVEYKEEHQAGLWVGEKKLVSIGIAVRRWVSFHGFALNVDCDLSHFQRVKPCGLSGDQVTSLRTLGITVNTEKVKRIVLSALERNFF